MTNQQRINAMWTAIAAVCEMQASTELEKVLVEDVQDFFLNPMYVGTQKEGFVKQLFIVDVDSIPKVTVKGMSLLFEPVTQSKVVNKMQPKPIEKQTDSELISTFVESGFAICHRLPNAPILQKKFKANYTEIADVITCVTSTSNNVLFPELQPGL